jgi:hypothetical protein
MHDSFLDSEATEEFPEFPPEKQGLPRFFPEAQARRFIAPRTVTQYRKTIPQKTIPQKTWRNGSVRLE